DPRTEAMVVQFASSGLRDLRENGDAFKAAAREGGLPMVISFVAEEIDAETRQDFRQAGILLSGDTAAAMRSLSWLYRRRSLSERPRIPDPRELPSRAAPAGWTETMNYLRDSGIAPA